MSSYSIEAIDLNKTFGRRLIFSKLSFCYDEYGIYGISGPNGSGKSTLVKIIAGLISASNGKVIHTSESEEIPVEKLHNHIGFVAPYLILYEEFSAIENLEHFSKIRGVQLDINYTNDLLDRFLLYPRRNDLVKTYSSGMKQRLKIIFSLVHHPQLLIFDEPTSNLDDEGKNLIYEIIKEQGGKNIVIIASNDQADLDICSSVMDLKKYELN
ncbi:MAG: ABC transporter ATP-binding protein [Ignavibacteria bacterium]|jgi:heme exporter protein A